MSTKCLGNSNILHPRVAIVGSGNWGTAVARIVGQNVLNNPFRSQPSKHEAGQDSEAIASEEDKDLVKMWVYEEMIQHEKLSDIINQKHENVKYLPNVLLPNNVRACPDLRLTCADADILLFVVPHQFLPRVLADLKGYVRSDAICVSLIKGIDSSSPGQLRRYTEIIQEELGVTHVAAVMGANVANDIAHDHFAETTVGCADVEVAKRVAALFHSHAFKTQITSDISTVEFTGALKNVVALGAGLCDGMGLGVSTKAAVIRQGLEEINLFCQHFDTTGHYNANTMFLSCGVGDLIATCFGGRNRKCSEEYAKRCLEHARLRIEDQDYSKSVVNCPNKSPACTGSGARTESPCQLWNEIEKDMLNGQKLQGVSTCEEVMHFLQSSRYLDQHPLHFPLFRNIFRIVSEGHCVDSLFHGWN